MERLTHAETREPGYYKDPTNGDLWHLSEGLAWSWVNGNRWSHLPEGLERVSDGNPFHDKATPRP